MRSIWKPYFSLNLYNKNLFSFTENFLFAKRNERILDIFISKNFKIYNGKSFKILEIKNYMIGHKFGEFFISKKKAVFKPKLKKK